jgi:hypothetical protein
MLVWLVLLCTLGATTASLDCSYPNVADTDRRSCAQCPPGRGVWNTSTSLCRSCTSGQFGGGNGTCAACPVAQYAAAEARTCKACGALPKCKAAKSRRCDPAFVGLCLSASSAGITDTATLVEGRCGSLFLNTLPRAERNASLCRANGTKFAEECGYAQCDVGVKRFLRFDHQTYGSVLVFISLWCVLAVIVPVASEVLRGGGDPRGKGKPAQCLRFALNAVDIACYFSTWWVRPC